ncbi:MAG: winged helix DNA-binding domain-containing protein, partial [Theionarchaea archaeon]|nr:winged helix DNA-binding domain-containing protein [Theionarchaea archaeon]
MLEISPQDARHALLTIHGFTSRHPGPEGIRAVFGRHRCVQTDPIEVAGRNADLTLQSRVSGFTQDQLYSLLYETRELFEYYCKMMSILPLETYPIFHMSRTHFQHRFAPFFKEHHKETAFILSHLEDGPICSRDFKGWKKVKWWGSTALSRVIIERLFICGRVMIHHREGAVKYYCATEDIIPPHLLDADPPDHARCREEMTRMIVRASRLVCPSGAYEQWYAIGKTDKIRTLLESLEKQGDIFPLKLKGFRKVLYAPVEDQPVWEDPSPPDSHMVRFLAPLDPLIWSRSLFAAVYGRKYLWEVYKKPEDREYGYYCLPILFDGSYVGLIEPYYRKEEST